MDIEELDGALSENSKTVAKGSFWSIIGQGFLKLTSFVFLLYVARAASPEDVGLFFLSLSIMSIFDIFCDLGASGALVRYIPYFESRNEFAKARRLLRYGYALLIISGTILGGLLYWQADSVAAFYSNPGLTNVLRIFSTYLIFNNLFRISCAYLQSKAHIREMQVAYNVQSVSKLVLVVIFFTLFGPSASMLAVSFILATVLAMGFASIKSYGIYQKTSDIGPQLSRSELIGEILPFGLLTGALGMLWLIVTSFDRIILGYLIAPSEANLTVGIYSVATTLANAMMMLPAAIGTIYFPVLARLFGKNDIENIKEAIHTSQRWNLLLLLPVSIILIVFSSEILTVLYGKTYATGSLVLSIFTLGLLFSGFAYLLTLVLASNRLIKLEFILTLAVAGLNFILNFLLIPIYGMEGAAMASAVSFVLLAILAYRYVNKLTSYRLTPDIISLIAAAILTFCIVALAKPYASSLIFSLPVPPTGDAYISKLLYVGAFSIFLVFTVAIFFCFALLLKCIQLEDVSLFKKILRRSGIPESISGPLIGLALFGVEKKDAVRE